MSLMDGGLAIQGLLTVLESSLQLMLDYRPDICAAGVSTLWELARFDPSIAMGH